MSLNSQKQPDGKLRDASASLRLKIIAVVLILLMGYAALCWPSHPRINRANFERIELGMSRADVETILGGPSGDYSNGYALSIEVTSFGFQDGIETWLANEGGVWVSFDTNDRVRDKEFFEPLDTTPPVWQRIIEWLRNIL